jgi:hypothetical protein
MRLTRRSSAAVRYAAGGVALLAIWAVATTLSGFSALQIVVFADPGLVLAISASWMAHVFSPADWSWDDALTAGAVGAAGFPPLVAFGVAWGATLDSGMTIALFVFGSWFALAAGLITGGFGLLRRRRRAAQAQARGVRLTMLD